MIGQPALEQMWLTGEGVDRQQLNGAHPQPREVGDGVRVGQPGIGAAQVLGHARTFLGEVDDVGLVDHRVTTADQRWSVVLPVEVVMDDDTARHGGGAVEGAPHIRVTGPFVVHLVAIDLRTPRDGALDRLGVGVEKELVDVVPQAVRGIPGPVDPIGVALSVAHPRHESEPPAERALLERDPPLGRARVVALLEEAQPHGLRVTGIHADVGTAPDQGDPGVRREVPTQREGRGREGLRGRCRGVRAGRHGDQA